MGHNEKIIATKRIFEGRIISLRVDTVELENGSTSTREVVEHGGGVGVLAIDAQDRVLLVRQFRLPAGQELLEIPAGKREKGEDPATCGIRELMEEAGCMAQNFESLGTLLPTPAYVTETIHLFLATGLTAGDQKLDEDEFLSVVPVPWQKAVEMVLSGEITDSKTQIAILKYNEIRRRGTLPQG